MTLYDAENKRQFHCSIPYFPDLVTLKTKASLIIDGYWIYSIHWSDNWVNDAKRDCKERIREAREDDDIEYLEEFEWLLDQLNTIEGYEE